MATISSREKSEFEAVESGVGDATHVPTPSKAHVVEQMKRSKQDQVDRTYKVRNIPTIKYHNPSQKVLKL